MKHNNKASHANGWSRIISEFITIIKLMFVDISGEISLDEEHIYMNNKDN